MQATIEGCAVPRGRVRVSGAKNSATRLLAAALLTDDPVELVNFPTELLDARHKARFIESLGGRVTFDDAAERVAIEAADLRGHEVADYDVPIRTTYLLCAAQLLRSGVARIPYPGGCKIGSRGYDLHVMVWQALGCTVKELPHCIEIRGDGFRGGPISFPISTVGGTENALICAAVARGTTKIHNAYITPEVEDLIALLRRMGASISVRGNTFIEVTGREVLHGTTMEVMADRIEALTWIVYGIMAGGELLVENVPFHALEVPLIHVQKAGIDLFRNSRSVYISPDCLRLGRAQPFELACGAHPGIISDMQPFYVLLAMRAEGISRVFDYRYPERIAYIDQLAKFAPGTLEAEPGRITVRGPAGFTPAHVRSTDLRGSMALVMAALCAEGRSVIDDVQMALRGYNNLQRKLGELGIHALEAAFAHPSECPPGST